MALRLPPADNEGGVAARTPPIPSPTTSAPTTPVIVEAFMAYLESHRRFVAVLNRRHESFRLMNALGHLTAGLAQTLGDAPDYLDYKDREGGQLGRISRYPFIVLESKNGSQLATLRAALLGAGLPAQAFVAQMLGESAEAQLRQAQEAPTADLDYVAVASFGGIEALAPLLKRFSLWKG